MSHNLQGADIRLWRDAAGLTQEEAARKLGIAREWLSKIENGRAPVSAEIYLKLHPVSGEPAFTHPGVTGAAAGAGKEAPAAPGPGDAVRREIRLRVEQAIAHAGEDAGRLGWIKEQVIQHVSTPEHWGAHGRVIKQVLGEEKRARPARGQSARAHGKAS